MRGRGASHCRGNRTQVARAGYGKSRKVFRSRTRCRASAASKILGTARRDEHGAALARSGQARSKLANCSLRSTAGSPKGFDTLDLKEAKALLEELAT